MCSNDQYIVVVDQRNGLEYIKTAKFETNTALQSFTTTKLHGNIHWMTESEALKIRDSVVCDKQVLACAVKVQPGMFRNGLDDPFTRCAIELAFMKTALELCKDFIEIENILYGVLDKFPFANLLIPIRHVRHYFGTCPEETTETLRVPGGLTQWITMKVHIQRMAVVDAYWSHVVQCISIVDACIPTIEERIE